MGGHFVTRLAQSYGILEPGLVRTLTHLMDNHLTPSFLETMRVVVNLGQVYGIPEADGDNDP